MNEEQDLTLDKTDALVTLAQACERSQCSINRILEALDADELKAVNIGTGKQRKAWRIRESELIRWWRTLEEKP